MDLAEGIAFLVLCTEVEDINRLSRGVKVAVFVKALMGHELAIGVVE